MRPERRFQCRNGYGRLPMRSPERNTTPTDLSLFKPKNGLDNGGHFRPDLADCHDRLARIESVAADSFKSGANKRIGDDNIELLTNLSFGVESEACRNFELPGYVRTKKLAEDLLSPYSKFTGVLNQPLCEVAPHPPAGALEHPIQTELLHRPSLARHHSAGAATAKPVIQTF